MDKSLELIHCDLKKITYLYRYHNSNKCVFIRKNYKNLHQIWKIYSSKECYYAEENVDTEMKVLLMGNNDTASPWVITFLELRQSLPCALSLLTEDANQA